MLLNEASPTINDNTGINPSVGERGDQPQARYHHPSYLLTRFSSETRIRARHRLKPKAQASLLGDHSVCDPPDPIPNSAVKPVCADGTVAQAPEE